MRSEQPIIKQASIDLLLRVLSKTEEMFTDRGEAVQIKRTMRFCAIACLICDPENSLSVMSGPNKFITCQDKKRYCQAALDLFADLPRSARDQERSSHFWHQLSVLKNTLKY